MRGRITPDQVLQVKLDAIARAEGGPMEGTVPLRWLADPTWRCAGCHVSKRSVEGRRGRVCVFRYCGLPVHLTFPGDRSGYLDDPSTAQPTRAPRGAVVRPMPDPAPADDGGGRVTAPRPGRRPQRAVFGLYPRTQ